MKRFGPRTVTSPIVSSSVAVDLVAVVVDEPDLDARHGHADVAGPARRVGADGGVHQRLGEAVALDDLLAGELLDAA